MGMFDDVLGTTEKTAQKPGQLFDDVLNPKPPTLGENLGDIGRLWLQGQAGLGGNIGYGLQKTGIAPELGAKLRESGAAETKRLGANLTPQMQEAHAEPLINPDYQQGAEGGQSWLNPNFGLRSLAANVVPSAPSSLAMGVAGAPVAGLATKGLGLIPGVSEKAARFLGSGVGFGGTEGVLSGTQNADQWGTEQRAINTDEFAKGNQDNPLWHEALQANNNDPEAAKEALISKGENDILLDTSLKTGALSALTGGGVPGLIKRAAHPLSSAVQDSAAKTVLKGMGTEFAQEAPQSFYEQKTTNQATKSYVNPQQDVNAGTWNAGLVGGISGGVMGAVGGGGSAIVGPLSRAAAQAQPVIPQVIPETTIPGTENVNLTRNGAGFENTGTTTGETTSAVRGIGLGTPRSTEETVRTGYEGVRPGGDITQGQQQVPGYRSDLAGNIQSTTGTAQMLGTGQRTVPAAGQGFVGPQYALQPEFKIRPDANAIVRNRTQGGMPTAEAINQRTPQAGLKEADLRTVNAWEQPKATITPTEKPNGKAEENVPATGQTTAETTLLDPNDFDHLSSEGLPLKAIDDSGGNVFFDHTGQEVTDDYAVKPKDPKEIQAVIDSLNKSTQAQNEAPKTPAQPAIKPQQPALGTGTPTPKLIATGEQKGQGEGQAPAPAIQSAGEVGGLKPAFADIHKDAVEKAQKFFKSPKPIEGGLYDSDKELIKAPGQPHSETNKQWQLAFDKETDRLKTETKQEPKPWTPTPVVPTTKPEGTVPITQPVGKTPQTEAPIVPIAATPQNAPGVKPALATTSAAPQHPVNEAGYALNKEGKPLTNTSEKMANNTIRLYKNLNDKDYKPVQIEEGGDWYIKKQEKTQPTETNAEPTAKAPAYKPPVPTPPITGVTVNEPTETEAKHKESEDAFKISVIINDATYAKSVHEFIKNNRKSDWENSKIKTKILEAGIKKHLHDLGFTNESAVEKASRIITSLKQANTQPTETKAEPITRDSVLEEGIKIAADSVQKLRKQDVFRVIDQYEDKSVRAKSGDYIKKNRPDLADEVDSVLKEIDGVNAEPVKTEVSDEERYNLENTKKALAEAEDEYAKQGMVKNANTRHLIESLKNRINSFEYPELAEVFPHWPDLPSYINSVIHFNAQDDWKNNLQKIRQVKMYVYEALLKKGWTENSAEEFSGKAVNALTVGTKAPEPTAKADDNLSWNKTDIDGVEHSVSSGPVNKWRYNQGTVFSGTNLLPEYPEFYKASLASSMPANVVEYIQKEVRDRIDWYDKKFGIISSKNDELAPVVKPKAPTNADLLKAAQDSGKLEIIHVTGQPKAEIQPKSNLKTPNNNDDLLAHIAKLGGINSEEAKAQGIDPKMLGKRGSGILRVFTKSGNSYNGMAETLRGYHFDTSSANDLVDKVSRAINQGEKIYNPAGYEAFAALKAQEHFDDELAQVDLNLASRIESGDIDVGDLDGLADKLFKDSNQLTGQAAIDALDDHFGVETNDQTGLPESNRPSKEEIRKTETPVKETTEPVRSPEYIKAQKDLEEALGDLGEVLLSANLFAKKAVPTELSTKDLIPVLTRVMDAAFRMGYASFKANARFVIDTIRSKFGDTAADSITIDHLQGSYIAMGKGTTTKKEVVNIESLDELNEVEPEAQKQATIEVTTTKPETGNVSNGPSGITELPEGIAPANTVNGAAVSSNGKPLDAGLAETNKGVNRVGTLPGGTGKTSGPGETGTLGKPGESLVGTGKIGTGERENVPADYVISEQDELGKGGLTKKYQDNVASIKIIKALETENRVATPDERKQLAKYVGWGALKGVFDKANTKYAKQYAELKGLLTEEEWRSALASVRNAHFTSPAVVKNIFAALNRLGFKGGRILEPAMGSGNFFGLMPAPLRNKSTLHGVELDNITSRLAKYLYPNAIIATNTGFQEYSVPSGYFDVAIGNPPFGEETITDKDRNPYSGFSIHNYFLARMLDKTREGGIVQAVVSNSFLDSIDSKARQYMADRANLIGAVRLPNTAFKESAGTEVVTDILFFQKTANPEKNPAWLQSSALTLTNAKTGETALLNRNDYYRDHPENVLGKESAAGTMYRANSYTVASTGDIAKQLDEFVKTLPEAIYQPVERSAEETATVDNEIPEGVKVGSFYINSKGTVSVRNPDVAGVQTTAPWTAKDAAKEQRMRSLIKIRDSLRTQMRYELKGDVSEKTIELHRKGLNKLYDEFVKKFGYINSQVNHAVFSDDTESALVEALEFDYDKGVSKAVALANDMEEKAPSATKADILTRRVLFPYQDSMTVNSAQDALFASLDAKGRLDLPYMAEMYNKSEDEIINELGDLAYNDPQRGVLMADEYLSGDVKTKLAEAKAAAENDPAFKRNVEALTKVIPVDKLPSEIYPAIGASWIPNTVYKKFVQSITGLRADDIHINYSRSTATWLTNHEGQGDVGKMTSEFGTNRIDAFKLFENMLANKATVIKDYAGRDVPPVINEQATEAARAQVDKIKAHWQAWIWADSEQTLELTSLFNEKHNRLVPRKYDGAHMTFPGKSPAVTLLPHQADGVWRAVQDRNTLLDHVVGAGKTYIIVASVMEMKRLGIARKPLIIVPNHLVTQWRSDFYRLYPGANVLAATPADFAKEKRKRFFSKIAVGDFDAIIVGHSSLKKLGLDPEVEQRLHQEQIREIAEAIEEIKRGRGDRNIIRDMEGIKANLESKLQELINKAGQRDTVVNFSELGIDGLVVDELHEFKNLYFTTQRQRIAGLGNPAGSGKAFDLFMKIRWLQDTFGPKAPLITATGTPVSNSLAEMFTMNRLMRYPEMKENGLHLFDAWANMYGEDESLYEVAPSGVGYRISQRFSKFKNLPSLMPNYQSYADTITLGDLKAQAEERGKVFPVPTIEGGRPTNIVATRSDLQRDFFGVPYVVEDEQGNIQYEINPDKAKIEKDLEGKWVLSAEGYFGIVSKTTFDTQEDAALELVEKALTPKVSIDPTSIVGQFSNLRELTRSTKGRINALSLTGLANKAGLDYRMIDPDAPDFADSKINKAVTNMVKLYHDWHKDKGAQLVFCDLSVPASARAAAALKDRRVFVLTPGGELTHKKGTIHTVEGHEGLPFYLVRTGKGEDAIVTVYEPVTGAQIETGFTDKRAAKTWVSDTLSTDKGRDSWFDLRDKYEPLDADRLAEYRERKDLEVEADGSNEVSMDELEGLAGSSKFSVYDDIKAKLIAQGIPGKEIAFIHDYSTPKQKDELFKKVRSGAVRFLFGSTQKMGAGTNVQERLVGLHHIDAPWRPSDLEQREGRIIRQGNALYKRDPDGFRIFIGRYATEQTYDTRRWQLLEHKASAIEQLRKYSGELELEDISTEASNSADMKAAASGNPLILEETALRGEVKRLNLLQRAHADSLYTMAREKRYEEERINTSYPRKINELNRFINTIANYPLPDDPKKIADFKVNDKKATTKEKASELVAEQIAILEKGDIGTVAVFYYRGLKFKLHKTGTSSWQNIELLRPDNYQMNQWSAKETISPSGTVTRLINFAESLPGRLQDVEKDMAKAQADIASYTEAMKQPFTRTQELADATLKHKEIERQLMNATQLDAVPPEKRTAFMKERDARKAMLTKLGYGEAVKEASRGAEETPIPAPEQKQPVVENIPGYGYMRPFTQGDNKEDAELVKGYGWMIPANKNILYSKATTPTTGSTVQQVKSWLTGQKRLNELVKSGKVQVRRNIGELSEAELQGGEVLFHAAWHGGPHEFERFESGKIGTGEGAQAFGYGHYFSDAKRIAEWYRDKLTQANSTENTFSFNGEGKFTKLDLSIKLTDEGYNYQDIKAVFDAIKKFSYSVQLAKQSIKKSGTKEQLDLINKIGLVEDKGKLYEVELAPTQDQYLDWDKPLSEQSELVKESLEKWAKTDDRDWGNTPGFANKTMTGEQLYKSASSFREAKDISDAMHKAGIRGIRYAAEGGKSEAKNYVIFSDEDISITNKYSKANQGAEGLYNPRTDKLYLFSDNLNESNRESILAHELLHRAEATDPKLKKALEQFEGDLQSRFNLNAKGLGSKIELAAYKRVIAANTPLVNQLEEYRAYIVSEYLKNPQSFTGKLLKTIKDFFAAIRMALVRAGLNFGFVSKLTPSDLYAMSKYGAQVKTNPSESSQWSGQGVLASAFAPDTVRPDYKGEYFHGDSDINKVVYGSGSIIKNPTRATALKMAGKDYNNELRGILDNHTGNLYIAKASGTLHEDMIRNAGLPKDTTYSRYDKLNIPGDAVYGYPRNIFADDVASPLFSKQGKRLAPNGKPSNLNAMQYEQVRTPEFIAWFGDWINDPKNASKVVDANGEPLVVYHATRININTFVPGGEDGMPFLKGSIGANKAGVLGLESGPAIWTTSNKENVQIGTGQKPLRASDEEAPVNVMELFVNLRNPLHVNGNGDVLEAKYPPHKFDLPKPYWDHKHWTGKSVFVEDKTIGFPEKVSTQQVKLIKEDGYDGIDRHYGNGIGSAKDSDFILFNPNQIKSATGNTGAFSSENNDIRYSIRADYTQEAERVKNEMLADRTLATLSPRQRIDKALNLVATKLNQRIFDRYRSFNDILHDPIAHIMARLSGNTGGAVEMAIKSGHPILDPSGAIDIDTSKKSLMKATEPLQGEIDDAMLWMAALRAEKENAKADAAQAKQLALKAEVKSIGLEIRNMIYNSKTGSSTITAEGAKRVNDLKKLLKMKQKERIALLKRAKIRERYITPDRIAALKTITNGTLPDGKNRATVYEQFRQDYEALNNAIVAIAVDTGTIDRDEAERWSNEGFYVPFFRFLADEPSNGPKTMDSLANNTAYQHYKGSAKPLDDLLVNVIGNWIHLVDSGLKNQAAKQAVDSAVAMGLMEKVESKIVGTTLAGQPIRKTADSDLFIRENGKKVEYRLTDPNADEGKLVLESLLSMNYSGINNIFMTGATKASSLLRFGVVANPAFKARNLIRDTLQALAAVNIGYNPFKNVYEGWKYTAPKGDVIAKMIASGGAFGDSGYLYAADSEAMLKQIKRQLHDPSVLNTKDKLLKMWDAYQDLGARLENVNRATAFQKTLKETGSLLKAANEANDLLAFQAHGSSKALYELSRTVPFLNAGLQGIDKMIRMAGNEATAKRFWTVTGMYVTASVMLALSMAGDDDYENAEDFEKETYHLFKIPGVDRLLKIPRPFEIGAMASIAERIAQQLVAESPDPEFAAGRIINILGSQMRLNPIPQVSRPALEIWANKSFFTGRDIESQGLQYKEKSQRGYGRTPIPATGLAKALSIFGEDTPILSRSPVEIDYLVNAYLGWLGAFTLSGTDAILRPLMGITAPSSMTKVPFLGKAAEDLKRAFVVDSSPRNTAFTTTFYDNLKTLESVASAMRTAREDKDTGRLEQIKEQYGNKPAYVTAYRRASTTMSLLNKMIEKTWKSDTMTGEQKRTRIDQLNQQRTALAKKTVDRLSMR
jgi:N12 class adenine-specific DNA methylase